MRILLKIKINYLIFKGGFIVLAAFLFLVTILIQPLIALAHGEGGIEPTVSLSEQISSLSSKFLLYSSIIIGIAVLIAIVKKERGNLTNKLLFGIIAVSIVAATLFFGGSTVYLNIKSTTKGPVHWHADFRIFSCGQEINIIDPSGISNRVGTSTLHEHGDNRLHIEGVVDDPANFSLHRFFEAMGGNLTKTTLSVPTHEGQPMITNGDACPDGQEGQWQVFAYQTEDDVVEQIKLADYDNYLISPHSNVPPGDCIIFEFDSVNKDKTEHLCASYEIAIQKGELNIK